MLQHDGHEKNPSFLPFSGVRGSNKGNFEDGSVGKREIKDLSSFFSRGEETREELRDDKLNLLRQRTRLRSESSVEDVGRLL